jgi:glyoxylase-like metal-dependent hydrolase (beta-lactamase superfamily II)
MASSARPVPAGIFGGAAGVLVVAAFASSAAAESWCDAATAAALAPPEAAAAGDDWFEVHSIAPGVFAISEPRQFEEVNSFLVVGSRRAVLFDSGLGVGRIAGIVQKLTRLPVTVLNSHTHFDHAGGNREFSDVRNLDDPYSLASARGEIPESLAAYARETLDEDRVCGPLPAGVTSRDYAVPTWRIAAHVRDGERLDLGGRALEILRTPGHTPDSICLLERESGLLLTGDTYYSGEIYLWAPETSVADYMASIDKLARLEPGLGKLLPGHGQPVAEPSRLLELQKALRDIQSGAIRAESTTDNRRLFRFEHFSILMSAHARD